MDRMYILEAFHPGTLVLYFAAMVILSACIPSFVFTFASFVAALLALALVDGTRVARLALSLEAFVILMALVSPFFDPIGNTILFTYFGSRLYTLEALLYGASVALIFAAMIAWFAVASSVITTDKLAYLFSGTFPKLGFVVISALTLVSRLARRAKEMEEPYEKRATLRGRIAFSAERLVNLIRWSFAEGAERVDAMRSRGFATGSRTSYARYRFTARDGACIACIAALVVIVVVGALFGGVQMTYFPAFVPGALDVASIASLAAFCALALALPALIGWGCARWHICASRI